MARLKAGSRRLTLLQLNNRRTTQEPNQQALVLEKKLTAVEPTAIRNVELWWAGSRG
jgi:hypothetical protein